MKVSAADVLRTAIMHFLALPENDPLLVSSIIESSAPPTIAQPRIATRYTGSGGSDQSALKAAAERQAGVKQEGGRLMDRTPVR